MKKILLAIILCPVVGSLCARTITFNDWPGKMLKVETGQEKGGGEELFHESKGLGAFRFQAGFQIYNRAGASDHAGFMFEGSKHRLHMFIRGNTFNFVPLTGGEGVIGFMSPGFAHVFDDASWNNLVVEYREGFVEVNCNNKYIGSFEFDLGKLQVVKAVAFRTDIAVRTASLDALAGEGGAGKAGGAGGAEIYANFDGTPDAGTLKATSAGSVRFVPGLKGQAARVDTPQGGGREAGIRFPVKLNPDEGTISFWFSPDWEGHVRGTMPWYYLLTGLDAEGKRCLDIFWWHWLRADLPRKGELSLFQLYRPLRRINHPGDWVHLAFVYNNRGWSTIYVNGLSYTIEGDGSRQNSVRVTNLDFGKVRELVVGSVPGMNGPMRSAEGAFDELRIHPRALSQEEIAGEYRKYFPFDLLLDKTAFASDEDVRLELAVAPADFYSIVKPAGYDAKKPLAPRKVLMRLRDADENRVLAEKRFEPGSDVNPQILALDAGKAGSLGPKMYQLQVLVENPSGAPAQRTFNVTVYQPKYPAAATAPAAPGSGELAVGKLIFTRDLTDAANTAAANTDAAAGSETAKGGGEGGLFYDKPVTIKKTAAGSYIEAGHAKGDRFAIEIPFKSAHRKGNPVLLEIEWPDDRARSTGFYMYPQSKGAHHRDRLMGGIQAGDEYPNSGQMTKTRYLFYPGVSHYLFEARTLANGLPAAAARVNVYELPAPLPALAVHKPEGFAPRHFGHMDEDQTIDITLNYDNEARIDSHLRTGRVLDKVTEYMNYTGQNMLSWSLVRYDFLYYPNNNYTGGGMLPRKAGEIPLFIHMLDRGGIDFVSSINITNLAEVTNQPERRAELLAAGHFLYRYKDEAARGTRPNFFNPVVRGQMLGHIKTVVTRYGSLPGFRGIDLWNGFTLGEELGYDDYTTGLFAARNGNIKLPESMKERYGYLNAPARRDAWLRFRADTLTAFLKEIVTTVRAANPDLTVAYSLSGEPLRGSHTLDSADSIDSVRWYYENNAVDTAALVKIPALKLTALRYFTDYRWAKHWGKPESTIDEQLYDPKRMAIFASSGFANSYPQYFETFNNSLFPEKYNAYFQNADPKPHGRYFLKELVFNVASMDATRILVGAQPFGSWGRDAESREFARAYTALPSARFSAARGPADPVTVRYLHASGDSFYFYAASLLWDDGSVTISLPAGMEITDLSSGQKTTVPADGRFVAPLKSYQLRSFLATPGGGAQPAAAATAASQAQAPFVPAVVETHVSQRQQAATAQRIAQLENTLARLKESGVTTTATVREKLAAVRQAVSRNEYAEAHRLLFSKIINNVFRQLPLVESGHLLIQQKMIAASRFAVNCGSDAYYTAKDGTLFFPDTPWNGTYGSVSDGSQIVRSTHAIKGTDNPGLYETEAYNLDSYRFKLPDGAYTLRVYLKIGYEPNARNGANVFSMTANGKLLFKNLDLFRESGHFNNAIVREFKGVNVTGGLLNIDFSVPSGVSPTVRFMNAIEVIPE